MDQGVNPLKVTPEEAARMADRFREGCRIIEEQILKAEKAAKEAEAEIKRLEKAGQQVPNVLKRIVAAKPPAQLKMMFNMLKTWGPVGFEMDPDAAKAHAILLLNIMSYVLSYSDNPLGE